MARVDVSLAGHEQFRVTWFYGDEPDGNAYRSAALYDAKRPGGMCSLHLRTEPGHRVVRKYRMEYHLATAVARAWCAGPEGEE
jgi:hypothetical protein